VLRWNGTSWSLISLPVASTVYGIWGSSATDVFAVTATGEVYRFDGASWTLSTSTNAALWAVHGTGPNDVYVSGEGGRVMRFNGSVWSTFSPTSTGTFYGLWANGASNVVTVGSDASGAIGLAYRYNGSNWQLQSAGANRGLMSVWGVNANDVYVTGEQGTLLHYNGSSWSPMTSGTSDLLYSVTGSPAGVGGAFAVGYNSTIVAGSSPSAFSTAALRMRSRTDLEPSAAARSTRTSGRPLPSGAARFKRKSTAAASGARTGLQLLKFGPRR
jgi:trimeric autotransporter adhesin